MKMSLQWTVTISRSHGFTTNLFCRDINPLHGNHNAIPPLFFQVRRCCPIRVSLFSCTSMEFCPWPCWWNLPTCILPAPDHVPRANQVKTTRDPLFANYSVPWIDRLTFDQMGFSFSIAWTLSLPIEHLVCAVNNCTWLASRWCRESDHPLCECMRENDSGLCTTVTRYFNLLTQLNCRDCTRPLNHLMTRSVHPLLRDNYL